MICTKIDRDYVLYGEITVIVELKDIKEHYTFSLDGFDCKYVISDIKFMVEKSGLDYSIITILVEQYLDGDVYRYGNHGPYWEHIGLLSGIA